MKSKLLIIFIIIACVLVKVITSRTFTSEKLLSDTWKGFKHCFITSEGQVVRPEFNDTVSEGQAYAMLRAVWMDDKEVFDRLFSWTEKNISRETSHGDNLLAWHYKEGKIIDSMPASDADVDYALSLILASLKWGGNEYQKTNYYIKALQILDDILAKETFTLADGKEFLSPWILKSQEKNSAYPLNPSYLSPAHFRTFYLVSKDFRWLKLVDSSYWLLDELSLKFNNQKGVGLIPDWCEIDSRGNISSLRNKNPNFGWEAVRIPFRVILDYLWYQETKALNFLENSFVKFAKRELKSNKKLFCEYNYSGVAEKQYENPLFYSAFAISLFIGDNSSFHFCLKESRNYIKYLKKDIAIYMNKKEYFVNALAWIPEALIMNRINQNPFESSRKKYGG